MLYTIILVPFSTYTCKSDYGSFSCPISHLPKPSTTSCKAACILFRHHLHINAARELVGKHLGSVWIGLILLKLKTYCWNHYSKIIFKCVNSAIGPIFNEKIDKKWNLWVREQYTDALFTENWSKVTATVRVPYMNSSHLWGENTWKKKKGKRRSKMQTPIQTLP